MELLEDGQWEKAIQGARGTFLILSRSCPGKELTSLPLPHASVRVCCPTTDPKARETTDCGFELQDDDDNLSSLEVISYQLKLSVIITEIID